MHGNIINQTMQLYAGIIKAIQNKDMHYLQQLDGQAANWDKKRNNDYFGHHEVIHEFIPTQYAPLNHIVEHFKPLMFQYREVDDPATRIRFKHPDETLIILPHPSVFVSPKFYGITLSHELAHATQVPLERLLIEPDSEARLKAGESNPRRVEELVAQMTSHKLMAMVGEDAADWSAMYMASVLLTLPAPLHEFYLLEADYYSTQAFKYLVNLGA